MNSHGWRALLRAAARVREWCRSFRWPGGTEASCGVGQAPRSAMAGVDAGRFSRVLVLILAGMSLTNLSESADAKTIHPAIGGSGDSAARDECDRGHYLVGVEIRTGSWWDRVTILCAPSTANGGVGKSTYGAPGRGGMGGGFAKQYKCVENSAVVSAQITLTKQNQVAWVTLGCSSNPKLGTGLTSRPTAGSQFAEGQRKRQRCPVGEAATGFDIRFGKHVNALGLICDTYNTPAAPAVDQNALNEQRKYEVQVTGKNMTQCQQSNAGCENRIRAQVGPIMAPGVIASQCIPFFQQCMANAAASQAAYAQQLKDERTVTGKTQEECVRSNQSCEIRIRNMLGINAMGAIPQECTPFFAQCMANAAQDLAKAASSAAPEPTPAPEPASAGGETTSICGLAGGPATVNIPNSDLTAVNVRDRPNGTILAQIAAGTQVNVMGGCGVRLAAGIVAQKPGAGGGQVVPGWCAISDPMVGCVSEQFLLAGAPAGGFGPAAGIVATKPSRDNVTPDGDRPNGMTFRVIKDANVRNGPSSKNTSVIGQLHHGIRVVAMECNASWCRVALPGQRQGWVSRTLLRLEDTGRFEDTGVFEDNGPAPPMTTDISPPMPGGATTSSCAVAGGTATVSIPDPNVTTLNVRDKPGGTILTVISEGAQVNVVGGCGVKLAAGIVAQKPGAGGRGVPGWCAISSPVVGCVSEKFLVAGIPTGPLAPAAGLVATRSSGSFTGRWNATAQGSGYTMMLNQNGNAVSGSYTSDDGSSGQIDGTLRGNVLRFTWRQTDGLGGAGKFALSDDANSFRGSFTLSDNPDVSEGSWNGRRR